MIAQIVFDLPIEGPFDYLIPEHLTHQVVLGTRVKVLFGPKAQIGFVIGLLSESAIAQLKPVQSLCDTAAIFNKIDLSFAQDFSLYYGCSLGEALGTMLRNRSRQHPSIRREHQARYTYFQCSPNTYAPKIQDLLDRHKGNLLILVPDTFRAQVLSQQLKEHKSLKIGMRSAVFECDGQYEGIIMVDEEDASYKQEQMPMYETRQVLLMRSVKYGFDVFFVGICPSVELMALAREGKMKLIQDPAIRLPVTRLVDLSNYKYVPGLISPPLRDALDAALKAGKKSVLILNRRGSYRLTRCVDCGENLKCAHCESSLIYSRKEGKFLCRHCTYTIPGDTVCPKCRKPSWKSVGIGVEQVQAELKKIFAQAKIASFERATESLNDFDILIATQAVLRFQSVVHFQVAAFIDFDAELNRLDMRSAFNAFSLALHISSMASLVFIQTRNIKHYVLEHLARGDIQGFYDADLKLRDEFGFSPFKHWVKISWRGKSDKHTHEAAQELFDKLSAPLVGKNFNVTPPLADIVGRKRDLFRYNVMVQTPEVPQALAVIKAARAQLKRRNQVIVALNIDP